MTTALWAVQILLAVVFTITGTLKLAFSRERLVPKMHWAETWPRARIKLLGLAEVAGALGLVLPSATHIAPALTPIAALCLAALMAGAIRTHRRLGERVVPAAMVGLLCVAVAAARLAV